MTDIVVGSGPSGIAVAKALLQRGRNVMMLDGGRNLEPAARSAAEAMAAHPPEQWSDRQRNDFQAPQFATPPGQVRRFGSDFAMEPGSDTIANLPDWFDLRASRAVGGLSNIWGSAVLPNRQSDISDWPAAARDLTAHYRAVAKFVPIAGTSDRIEDLWPAFPMAGRQPVPASRQGEKLGQRLDAVAARLTGMGVYTGRSRLAVAPGCKSCGMCLHGCPWNLIFSARPVLEDLNRHANFSYRPGWIVRRFDDSGKDVQVISQDGQSLQGERLFIAAGVLETARIAMASVPAIDKLTMLDSHHAFVPMLHRWSVPARPDQMPLTTLPQLFIEIDNPTVSPHLVHAQIYTWNEFFSHDLTSRYGRLLPGTRAIWQALARRLIVAQVFLHSDHSARIGLRLAPEGRLGVDLQGNNDTAPVMRRARRHLARAMNKAGLTTLSPAARPGAPGSSFHVGGILPMSQNPGTASTDPFGRLAGSRRVHVVDASVLPSIPATTITFTVMANAHRIGLTAP